LNLGILVDLDFFLFFPLENQTREEERGLGEDEHSCKLRSYPQQCALVPNGFGCKRKLLLGLEISCPKQMIRTKYFN